MRTSELENLQYIMNIESENTYSVNSMSLS